MQRNLKIVDVSYTALDQHRVRLRVEHKLLQIDHTWILKSQVDILEYFGEEKSR